jgi:hypothetical protein
MFVRVAGGTGLVLFALGLFGCRDTQVFTREPDIPKRPIGDACTVDAECTTGRCIAGVCHDDGCQNDSECRNDEICVFQVCEPVDLFACQPDQAPLLSIAPGLAINFGQVRIGQVGERIVTVENVGDCLLTLSAAGLDSQGDVGFGCEPCDPRVYPQRIPPNQSLDILVHYAPINPGVADSTLLIRSDDVTAGDRGLVEVALHAEYDGEPLMVVTPPELNFGFVPFVAGGQQGERTEVIEITNRGTGNAALIIERLFVNNGIDFTIPPEFDDIDPDSPLIIPPFNADDPATTVRVPVTFRPTRNAALQDELVIRPQGSANTLRVLRGSSLGPPQIVVSTDQLIFKCGVGTAGGADVCPTNEAYPVGTVTFRTVTITNQGQSELNVNLTFGGEAGDFSVSPSFIPPIAPGGAVPLSVFFQPSGPSDPANRFNPIDPFDAVLNITSNDTDPATDVLKTVVVKGFSKGGQNDQALKLEMEFQNADNSWAGNDFRDVDLELQSPLGFSCTKPTRFYAPDGQGGFVVSGVDDPCEDWTATGQEGRVNWLAVGQFEEPERIILFGLGPTATEGQSYIARVFYQEDCANIPTGLLADILGIGGSILLGILGGAVGVPITVPPDQISNFVSQNCFDRESTLVTLHISLDGAEVAAPQRRLNRRGDVLEIARLQRRNGQFCDPNVGIPCP